MNTEAKVGRDMGEFQRVECKHTSTLPNHPPWSHLSQHGTLNLLERASHRHLERGDVVESDVGIVLSGALAIECELFDGRRILCALFHAGNLVDLRCAARGRQGRLVALISSEFLSLHETRVEDCVSSHPDVAFAFVIQLRDNMVRMQHHAADLSAKTPTEKLASLLFEFARWPDKSGIPYRERPEFTEFDDGVEFGPVQSENTQSIRLPIQRTDIADYIGVKPETLSRAIRKLEREGLIALPHNDHFVLADVASLRRIANGGRPRQSTRRC